MTTGPELHPALTHLAGLLGVWQGGGSGSYPTIDDFSYTEEVSFGHVGKPFLSYTQKTRNVESGMPLHAESGYLRATDSGLEFVIAQPTGIIEILVAPTPTTAAWELDFRPVVLSTSPTAVDVAGTERHVVLAGDSLSYSMAMAAAGEPMTHHLSASLKRV